MSDSCSSEGTFAKHGCVAFGEEREEIREEEAERHDGKDQKPAGGTENHVLDAETCLGFGEGGEEEKQRHVRGVEAVGEAGHVFVDGREEDRLGYFGEMAQGDEKKGEAAAEQEVGEEEEPEILGHVAAEGGTDADGNEQEQDRGDYRAREPRGVR